ncbi:MAG: DUF2975 domain-containing protein [Bacillota bacterium]|nr:DUF2975 domain-containing protein [Bacillota bacterium]
MESKVINNLVKFEKAVKIIFYTVLIGGCIIFAGIILLFVLHQSNVLTSGKGGIEFSIPGLIARFDIDVFAGPLKAALISTFIRGLMYWLLFTYIILQFHKILRISISECTPFTYKNAGYIRNISYSFFIYAIIDFVIQCIQSIWFKKIQLTGIHGIDLYYKITFPLWPVLVGFIVLCIAQFFTYGLKLQQDNDSII